MISDSPCLPSSSLYCPQQTYFINGLWGHYSPDTPYIAFQLKWQSRVIMCLVTVTGHQACAVLLLNQFDIRVITRQITSFRPLTYPGCKGKSCISTTTLAPLCFKVPLCFLYVHSQSHLVKLQTCSLQWFEWTSAIFPSTLKVTTREVRRDNALSKNTITVASTPQAHSVQRALLWRSSALICNDRAEVRQSSGADLMNERKREAKRQRGNPSGQERALDVRKLTRILHSGKCQALRRLIR